MMSTMKEVRFRVVRIIRFFRYCAPIFFRMILVAMIRHAMMTGKQGRNFFILWPEKMSNVNPISCFEVLTQSRAPEVYRIFS